MAAENEQEPGGPNQSIDDFLRARVRDLLHAYEKLTLEAALDPGHVQVLHLIDLRPQQGTPIDYHCVYATRSANTSRRSYGVYVANPWPRYNPKPDSYPSKESRHYFDAGQKLVVREDTRRGQREFEFLRGPINTAQLEDPELAETVLGFHNDLANVAYSEPLKPLRLIFDKFVWAKG